MISEKEFDRDAAMLAGIVGGHLNYIDKFTSESNVPANKIDINKFILPLRGGPPPMADPFDPINKGVIPEELVKSTAPDVSVNFITEAPTQPMSSVVSNRVQPVAVQNVSVSQELLDLKDDIKSIKSTLLKIDGTFSKIAGMIGKVFNVISQQETFIKK
jgi:hypothetical protein